MSDERLNELTDQLRFLPPGRARAEMLEMAINEADALGRGELGYRLRMDLIRSAVFHGMGERAIAAYAWCLKFADEHPQEIELYDLLWTYKWILGILPRLPQIPHAKLLEMIDDLGRRAEAAGYSQRPVHHARCKLYAGMGDMARAKAERELWLRSRADGLQDCSACEANSEVDYFARLHDDERALEFAQPILKGRLKCSSVPQATLAEVIRPLLRLNRIDEAVKFSERGYRLTSKNETYLYEVAEHLLLATRACQNVRGIRMFTRHAEWSLTTGTVFYRYAFDRVAAVFLEKLARGQIPSAEGSENSAETSAKRRSPGRIRLPKQHPLHRSDDRYDLLELAEWYRQEADELARQFDRRNGNTYHQDLIEETRQLAAIREIA